MFSIFSILSVNIPVMHVVRYNKLFISLVAVFVFVLLYNKINNILDISVEIEKNRSAGLRWISQEMSEKMKRMARNNWRPQVAPLMTRWASKVNPDNPHPQYPRPQMVRDQWMSLNGVWDLEVKELTLDALIK